MEDLEASLRCPFSEWQHESTTRSTPTTERMPLFDEGEEDGSAYNEPIQRRRVLVSTWRGQCAGTAQCEELGGRMGQAFVNAKADPG